MKHRRNRGIIYILGLLILAMGITLNTKTGLGVSPIVSVPYAIGEMGGWQFGNVTLLFYVLLAGAEYVLKWEKFRAYDLLQIPLSLVFTRFLNGFSAWIPAPESMGLRVGCLVLAVVCTGIGGAMSVDARLVPNPGDGIVQAISDRTGKGMGLCKNCFDLGCILLTAVLGLCFGGRIVGIGVGTLVAVAGVGRVVALFQRLFLESIERWAGLTE